MTYRNERGYIGVWEGAPEIPPISEGWKQHQEFMGAWGEDYKDLIAPMRKFVRADKKDAAEQ